jgi:hypothetical protein
MKINTFFSQWPSITTEMQCQRSINFFGAQLHIFFCEVSEVTYNPAQKEQIPTKSADLLFLIVCWTRESLSSGITQKVVLEHSLMH